MIIMIVIIVVNDNEEGDDNDSDYNNISPVLFLIFSINVCEAIFQVYCNGLKYTLVKR